MGRQSRRSNRNQLFMARQSPFDVAASDHFASNGSPAPAVKPVSADGLLEEFLRYGRPDLPIDGAGGEKLLRQVVELARILTGASGSAIAFRGEHGTICRATSGKGAPPIGASVDGSSGITKQCLDSGISVRCDDIATDRRVDPSIIQTIGIRAVAVVPIHREWDVIGILEVFSTTPGNFTFQHLKRLQQLAGWVGSAYKALQNPLVLVSGPSARSEEYDAGQVAHESPMLASATLHAKKVREETVAPKISGEDSASELDGWDAVLLPDSHLPWKRFVQSVFFHVMLVGMFWGFSEFGPHELDLSTHPVHEARITYYPLSQSAPQRGISSAPKTARTQHVRGQQKLKVNASKGTPERQVASTSGAAGSKSEVEKPKAQASATPISDLPPAALSRLRRELNTPAPVSPQPGADGILTRRSQGSTLSAIAPAPEFAGGPGSRRANPSGVGTSVVPPPPELGHLRGGSSESVDISIVPPPPAIADHAVLTYRSSGIVSKNGTQIVAPAPSFDGRTKLGAGGTTLLPNGGVAQLVPPPASLDGSGGLAGSGQRRGASLARGNSEIIAPAPSLQGDGKGREAARMASLGNGGMQVVPPAPSVQGGANYRGGSRSGVLDGTGSAVVAPPPSGTGLGGFGGRGNSLAGSTQIVGPPPGLDMGAGQGRSNGGTGSSSALAGLEGAPPEPSQPSPSSGAGGSGAAGSGAAAGGGDKNTTPSSKANDEEAATHPVFQDAQVKVISLAWAPPRSSYFSSFEVFIAQKWVNKDKTEMIKLVYVFLPYQKRLSEYGVENPKIRRLRVTRDPSCDESLMQLAWPEGGGRSASDHQNSGSSNAEDRNLLPCYRTTADEYRHAVSRNR
jgi:hypothetical protein